MQAALKAGVKMGEGHGWGIASLSGRTFLTGRGTGEGFNRFTQSWHLIKCAQSMKNTICKLNILNRQIAKTLEPKSHYAFFYFTPNTDALQ